VSSRRYSSADGPATMPVAWASSSALAVQEPKSGALKPPETWRGALCQICVTKPSFPSEESS